MKRYIRSDSRIKPTANIYTIAEAMGWGKPDRATGGRYGYTCHMFAPSTEQWPSAIAFVEAMVQQELAKIYSISNPMLNFSSYPNTNPQSWNYFKVLQRDVPDYMENREALHEFYTKWNSIETKLRKQFMPQVRKKLQSDVLDVIEQRTGIKCMLSRGDGHIIVPYAD